MRLHILGQKKGLQKYYISSMKNHIKGIDTRWTDIKLPEKTFVIDTNLLRVLERQCCFEKFNKISLDDNFGEIRKKIRLALNWFLKALLEKDITDEAIALFISLEALMATTADPLTSHTDELAENMAIITYHGVDARYKAKKNFRETIYPMRNKIMHHGHLADQDKDWETIGDLRLDVVWAIRWIIEKSDTIMKFGNKAKAIREYFEREKLK